MFQLYNIIHKIKEDVTHSHIRYFQQNMFRTRNTNDAKFAHKINEKLTNKILQFTAIF